MTLDLSSDRALAVLTGTAIAGILLAVHAEYVQPGPWGTFGLVVVFLAGGLPASWRALKALWQDHMLDIVSTVILSGLSISWALFIWLRLS